MQPEAPPLARRLLPLGSLAILIAILLVSARQVGFSLADLWYGTEDFFIFFGQLVPDWRALPEVWGPMLETLQIAYLGTLFGTLIAAPLIFLSSFNTAPNAPTMWISRSILTVVRSIPDLLYAAILAPMLAFGALPGIVALTIFSTAVLAKMTSETVESVDPGPLEAVRATGGGNWAVVVYSVIPQVSATATSYILYVFEINVRASAVLGLVGAGGLGQLLDRYLSFFDYGGISVLIIVIFISVLIIDGISIYFRSRLI